MVCRRGHVRFQIMGDLIHQFAVSQVYSQPGHAWVWESGLLKVGYAPSKTRKEAGEEMGMGLIYLTAIDVTWTLKGLPCALSIVS